MRYFVMGLAVVLCGLAVVVAAASGFAWLCQNHRDLGSFLLNLLLGFAVLMLVGIILCLANVIGQSIRDRFEDGLGFRLFGWRFEVRDERSLGKRSLGK